MTPNLVVYFKLQSIKLIDSDFMQFLKMQNKNAIVNINIKI